MEKYFAISLYNDYRGQGIGTGLMKEMLSLLKVQGFKKASLAVQKMNYAVCMYEKVGFQIVYETEEEYIMVCELYGGLIMPFDYKKEYKEFYMPKNKPSIVTVPSMNYIAVRGHGDPNAEDGEYKQSIGLLYGIAFTIKMSKKGSHRIDGYFDYVVPPLEGFWWQEGVAGIDYAHKENLEWISVIRLPDFVTKADFDWAVSEATKKKKTDFSKVEFLTYDEGLCVQCMHIGSYDDEPTTVALMHDFMVQQGYALDITDKRLHHEIYLSDARKVAPEKLKTVIRHPIK